jgi:hypothetical protein
VTVTDADIARVLAQHTKAPVFGDRGIKGWRCLHCGFDAWPCVTVRLAETVRALRAEYGQQAMDLEGGGR